MKKVTFTVSGGTARERAVGVVSDGAAAMARLRVLPESERKERIQRMYDRHRRRELAKVVVSQWKWVARTRLQRVRDRTSRARELVAAAHHRNGLLRKTFAAVSRYARYKADRRAARAADLVFLRRHLSSWRRRALRSGERSREEAAAGLAWWWHRLQRGVFASKSARRVAAAALCTWRRAAAAAARESLLALGRAFAAWRASQAAGAARIAAGKASLRVAKAQRHFVCWRQLSDASSTRRRNLLRHAWAALRGVVALGRAEVSRSHFNAWREVLRDARLSRRFAASALLVPAFRTWKAARFKRRRVAACLQGVVRRWCVFATMSKLEKRRHVRLLAHAMHRWGLLGLARRVAKRNDARCASAKWCLWRCWAAAAGTRKSQALQHHRAKMNRPLPHVPSSSDAGSVGKRLREPPRVSSYMRLMGGSLTDSGSFRPQPEHCTAPQEPPGWALRQPSGQTDGFPASMLQHRSLEPGRTAEGARPPPLCKTNDTRGSKPGPISMDITCAASSNGVYHPADPVARVAPGNTSPPTHPFGTYHGGVQAVSKPRTVTTVASTTATPLVHLVARNTGDRKRRAKISLANPDAFAPQLMSGCPALRPNTKNDSRKSEQNSESRQSPISHPKHVAAAGETPPAVPSSAAHIPSDMHRRSSVAAPPAGSKGTPSKLFLPIGPGCEESAAGTASAATSPIAFPDPAPNARTSSDNTLSRTEGEADSQQYACPEFVATTATLTRRHLAHDPRAVQSVSTGVTVNASRSRERIGHASTPSHLTLPSTEQEADSAVLDGSLPSDTVALEGEDSVRLAGQIFEIASLYATSRLSVEHSTGCPVEGDAHCAAVHEKLKNRLASLRRRIMPFCV